MPVLIETFRLRVRNALDTADLLVATMERGGVNPFLAGPPSGEGSRFDPITSHVDIGTQSIMVIDEASFVTAIIGDAANLPAVLGLRAYLELSSGGAYGEYFAGFVTGCEQVDAITYAFTIGETRRAEVNLELFKRVDDTFTQGTSLIGGPIRGAQGTIFADHGGWTFRVAAVAGDVVALRFVSGDQLVNDPIAGPVYRRVTGAVDPGLVNAYASPDAVRDTTTAGVAFAFPDYIAWLSTPAGAAVGEFVPVAKNAELIEDHGTTIRLKWPAAGSPAQPSVGTDFLVYVESQLVNERTPLHWRGHPADLAGLLHDLTGMSYDAASLATVKDAIGSQMIVLLRPTKPINAKALLDALFSTFKFSRRPLLSGDAVEFFRTVVRTATVPTTSVALADLLSTDPVIFNLNIESKRNQLVFAEEVILPWDAGWPGFGNDGGEIPADGLMHRRQTWTVNSPDDDADGTPDDQALFGVRSETIEFPGFVLFHDSAPLSSYLFGILPGAPHPLADALASEMFSRRLKGEPSGQMLVHPSKVVKLGEEILAQLPHQVNVGTVPSSRGGTRVVQVIQRTPTEAGVALRVVDSGTTTAMPTAPTLTLAAAADDPDHVVVITITNAAALAADFGLIRIEWATGASAPSANGQLLTEGFPVLITPVRTPPVSAGTKVWVRAQTTDLGGRKRATAFTAWASVTLTGLTAPNTLTRVNNVLSWVNGETAYPVEVLWRVGSEPDRRAALLPAGSVTYDLAGLVPASTSITATVRHRDQPPLAGVSSSATITYTTPGTSALSAPVAPTPFIEPYGGIGMQATATEVPSSMEFEVAVETAVGSGTPGSYTRFATVPAVSGGATSASIPAPADNLVRYFRARSVAEGRTASSYTAVVSGTPWDIPIPPSTRRKNTTFVNDAGTVDGYAARGTDIGDLNADIDAGDFDVIGGSPFVEAVETLKVGSVASPDAITKTIKIPYTIFGGFDPAGVVTHQYTANGVESTDADQVNLFGTYVLPRDVTITAIRVRFYRIAAVALELTVKTFSDSGVRTTIATINGEIATTGFFTVSAVVSHAVGSAPLEFDLTIESAGDAAVLWIEMDYQMGSYDKTI